MGCSKSSAKREVYRNTSLLQKTRETSNKQPKATRKRRTAENNLKLVEAKKSYRPQQKKMKKK